MKHLLSDPDFVSTFEPGESSGFIRDMELPPFGTTAKIGGRLLPGTEAATSKAIEQLHRRVVQAIDTTQEAFQRWALSVGEKLPGSPAAAALMPVQFAKEPRHADERAHDVARVFTAIEKVSGADCLEGLLTNIATKLRREELDEDTIDTILINLRNQRQPRLGGHRFTTTSGLRRDRDPYAFSSHVVGLWCYLARFGILAIL